LLTTISEGQIMLADRGYNSDGLRAAIASRGAWANIKPMPNRVNILPSVRGFTATATSLSASSTSSNTSGLSQPDPLSESRRSRRVPGPGLPPVALGDLGQFVLPRGTVVHRFCALARPPNMFTASRRANSFRAALCDDCDCPASQPPAWQVFYIDLAGRSHARLLVNQNLILGPFFHQNLARIGRHGSR
jgi:hypothetical protein